MTTELIAIYYYAREQDQRMKDCQIFIALSLAYNIIKERGVPGNFYN